MNKLVRGADFISKSAENVGFYDADRKEKLPKEVNAHTLLLGLWVKSPWTVIKGFDGALTAFVNSVIFLIPCYRKRLVLTAAFLFA